jgi:hypothetical protein
MIELSLGAQSSSLNRRCNPTELRNCTDYSNEYNNTNTSFYKACYRTQKKTPRSQQWRLLRPVDWLLGPDPKENTSY